MYVYWEIHLAQRATLKVFISNIPLLKIIYCTIFEVHEEILVVAAEIEKRKKTYSKYKFLVFAVIFNHLN